MHAGTPPTAARLSIIDRWQVGWILFRNGFLGSPGFQRFAFRFLPFRPIALARSRAVFDLVAGFVYSQITLAFVESGLLAALRRDPLRLAAAADVAAMDRAGALRLLKAAQAIGLAQQLPDGRWALGRHGAAMGGTTGTVEMIAHHRALYADLAEPLELLRRGGGGGRLAQFWPYAADGAAPGAEDAARYSALMAASQPAVAAEIIASYPFGRHQRVLDVGGGEGAFLEALGHAYPTLQRALFDLPAVAARAAGRLGPDVAVHGGSFRTDALPPGADLITLVRILHDHDDHVVAQLLQQCRAALPAHGRLLIAEPMAGVAGAEAAGDAYFGFYLLAMGSGRPRTRAELSEMLHQAGFRRARPLRTAIPLATQLIVAEC